MDINDNIESPLILKVSFNKYLNQFKKLINADNDFIAANAKRILKIANDNPLLIDGFSDTSLFKTYETEIESLLLDAFSPVLTKNEIKTASVPFHDLIFNSSKRFKSILNNAGEGFELQIKNMPVDQRYIIACTIILNFCYGYNLNLKRPFFYEIPDANGVMRYYKILYNADFTEIVPKKNAPKITEKDYHELLLKGLVSIPKMRPGDTIWWHPDIVHAVEDKHLGKNYSNVVYVGATPYCKKNLDYTLNQSKKFLEGKSPPDFAPEDYEVDYKDRIKLKNLSSLAKKQLVLDENN